MEKEKLLEVNDLKVSFDTHDGEVQAVRGVTFYVRKGETLGLVGESGCGKSVTSKTINRLLKMPPARIAGGEILFEGNDLIKYSEKEMRKIRGNEISMIFQDPMTSLNPTMKVGNQIVEALVKHEGIKKDEAKKKAIEMLTLVGLPNPEVRYNQYPHQFSGGMRQRAMIALAMVTDPKLLIADEPTTALDVTIQAQILRLMKKIQKEFNTAIIMITHDLGVIANTADRVAVMYAGKIVETATTEELFYEPKHPYTWGLLESVPNTAATNKQELKPIDGTPPDLLDPPKGCPFAPRCKYAMKICKVQYPDMTRISENHTANCWLLDERSPKVEVPVAAIGRS